nr:MAG TPA: hypothetical protein [Caudoviricetes sp.]
MRDLASLSVKSNSFIFSLSTLLFTILVNPHTQSLAIVIVGIFMLQYYKRLFGATI